MERLEPEYNPTFWKLVNMLESELTIMLMPILVLLKKVSANIGVAKKVSAFVPGVIQRNLLESGQHVRK